MTEDEKMQVAVFRFSVIGDFVNGTHMSATENGKFLFQKKPGSVKAPSGDGVVFIVTAVAI